MSTPPHLVCSTCQSAISGEELAQGLAVRIDGELVCSMCVDLLPGRAQLEINKFRALKGLTATTYSVEVPGHPENHRFTFTTSGNVLFHRRSLRDGGTFSAPPLPAQEPHAPAAAVAPTAPSVPVRPRARLPALAVAGGVAALLAIGIGAMAVSSAGRKPRPTDSHRTQLPTRADYPADPAAAWAVCTADGGCPEAVARAVGQELRQSVTMSLDRAADDLDHGKTAAARSAIESLKLPEDPLFADLRARGRTLTSRLAQADQPSTGHVTKKTVHEPAPGDQPGTTPVLEPGPEPEAGPDTEVEAAIPDRSGAGVAPGPECWQISSDDLMAAHPGTSWKAGGELTGAYGTLERQLPPVAGGCYQVWIQASVTDAKGSASILIDGRTIGTIAAKTCLAGGWRPIRMGLDLPQGPCLLTVKAHGSSWRIGGLYLAGADRPGPEGATATAAAPPWLPIEQPPQRKVSDDRPAVVPPKTTTIRSGRSVATWAHAFVWPVAPKEEPLDGSVNVPSPWPGGAEPFHRSQRPAGPKHAHMLELELAKADVDAGGIVVLVHRVRADRKSLSVAVESQLASRTELVPAPTKRDPTATAVEDRPDKVTLPLDPLTFADNADWQVFAIPFPDLAPCGERLWLKLEDVADLGPERGFLLGKVVTVAKGVPSPSDLDLMASPLVAGDVISNKDYQRKLVAMLAQVATHRSNHKWNDARGMDARKVKLLVTNADGTWETEMRRQLARILGLKEAPRGSIENLGLAENWFADKQFKGAEPLIDADDHTLAVVCLNGEEAGCSLKDPQALDRWMRTIASSLIGGDRNGKRGGFIPVIVVGRTEKIADFAQQALIDTAWMKVRDDCMNTGLPLIDIRGAQSLASKSDVRACSAQLLADGLRTLIYQVSWAQKYVRQ